MLFLGVYTLRAHAQCATGGQFAPTFRCQGAPRATLSMAFSASAATRPPAWDRQGATGRLEKNTDIYKHVFHICFKHFQMNSSCVDGKIYQTNHMLVLSNISQHNIFFHRSRNPSFNALHAHQITRLRL